MHFYTFVFITILLNNNRIIRAFTAPLQLSNSLSNSNVTDKYEDHRVVPQQAKQAAQHLAPNKMIGHGCKKCIEEEIEYCRSEQVIQDHCCCDGHYHEMFPYIEHVCYIEENICNTSAQNCVEYNRFVECCCHQILATIWKDHYSKSSQATNNIITIWKFKSIIILLLLFYFNYYYYYYSYISVTILPS